MLVVLLLASLCSGQKRDAKLCLGEGFDGDTVVVIQNGVQVFRGSVTSMNSDRFTVCLDIQLDRSDNQIFDVQVGGNFFQSLSYSTKMLKGNVIAIDISMIDHTAVDGMRCALSSHIKLLSKTLFKW